jgi:predicted dehydrogenase
MTPLRIAVFGAGMIGRRHIETVLACPDSAELVGVADPTVGADRFPEVRAPFFASHLELLERVKPEAAVIATPNNLHAPQGIDCARRGVHFIVEKPVTESLDSATALLRAVREAGVKTLVGHQRRYLPALRTAKEMIAAGRLGRLVGAAIVWATRKPDPYFAAAEWRRQPGGGPVLINVIHDIDNLRYLAGEIATITGLTSNAVRGFAVEDTSGVIVQFASGAVATVLSTDTGFSPWTLEQSTGEIALFPQSGENAYRFIGTEGALELPNLKFWSARTPGEIGWDKPLKAETIAVTARDPYIAQLEHFCRVIRTGETPVIAVEDGARTLAATLAVAESSRLKRPIELAPVFARLSGTDGAGN